MSIARVRGMKKYFDAQHNALGVGSFRRLWQSRVCSFFRFFGFPILNSVLN
jgi:hypothetical protein